MNIEKLCYFVYDSDIEYYDINKAEAKEILDLKQQFNDLTDDWIEKVKTIQKIKNCVKEYERVITTGEGEAILDDIKRILYMNGD